MSGKEKYYTGDKKYCNALGRQRKHLVISEELHGYNLGQSLALTALSAYHFPVPSALSVVLHGCKSRVSLLKTTVPKQIKAIQTDGAVNEITP